MLGFAPIPRRCSTRTTRCIWTFDFNRLRPLRAPLLPDRNPFAARISYCRSLLLCFGLSEPASSFAARRFTSEPFCSFVLAETAAGHYQCRCYGLRCRLYSQAYHGAIALLVRAPLLYRAAAAAIALLLPRLLPALLLPQHLGRAVLLVLHDERDGGRR